MNRKQFIGKIKSFDDNQKIITHSITSLVVDRDGEVIIPKGCKYDNFFNNPVVLFAHKYDEPTIGKCLGLEISDDEIVATTQFADTNLGNELYKLYKEGFMNAWSVGFIPLETGDKIFENQKGTTYTKWELLEYSAVPVPSNPQALTLARSKGLVKELDKYLEADMEKGVIPFESFPLASEDTEWDGPKEIREAEVEDLKLMCAWYDSENPDIKSSYKLPHHRASDKYTVWRGVAAAMGALLGARGGVDIPDKDKQGVYNHLAKHYKEFDKEPPEFRSYTEEELKEIFKEGRVLSAKNRELIKNAITQMQEAIDALNDLLEATEPQVESYKEVKEKSLSLEEFLRKIIKEVK